MVTIYHFDLPANIQLLGGFANSAIVQYFEDYANLLFARFGDRVKYWITVNEPAEFCTQGYGGENHAPGINAHGIGEYLCVHNSLKAHAAAYHLYKHKYYNQYKGQVGISLDSLFFYSDSNDTTVVNRATQFSVSERKMKTKKKRKIRVCLLDYHSWVGRHIQFSAQTAIIHRL